MTREEVQDQLDIIMYDSQRPEAAFNYEDKVEAEQKLLAHDQAQREEIARLREALEGLLHAQHKREEAQ